MDTGDNVSGITIPDTDVLERILSHLGEMGRYQQFLFIFMMPCGFFYAYVYFVQMFITATPEIYWCSVPELAHLDLKLRRILSSPGAHTGHWNKCATFDVDWTEVLVTMTPPPPGTPTKKCNHGWDFELSDFPYATVVSERGWVCHRANYVPAAQAMFFAGAFVGGSILGWIADNYGRVPAVASANLIGGIGGIATIFTTGLWDFALCRFIVGMSFDNMFMMPNILLSEYVGPSYRTWVGGLTVAIFFGLSCVSVPWVSLWISDWRKLLWYTSTPMLVVAVSAPYVLPESVRWYVSKGRIIDAVHVLRRFEKVNRKKIPDKVMKEFVVTANYKREPLSLIVLMKSATLRVTVVVFTILYMLCALIFDGLLRMSEDFGFNYFIAFTLTSATTIPSVMIVTFLIDRWGRRPFAAGTLGISAVLMGIAAFVPRGLTVLLLAIMARFFVNMGYNATSLWATDLLPTVVRASGSSELHMSGYVVNVLSPFIVYSERFWLPLPLVVLTITAVLASLLSLVLPETNGWPMTQTIEDSEKLVQGLSLHNLTVIKNIATVKKPKEKATDTYITKTKKKSTATLNTYY